MSESIVIAIFIAIIAVLTCWIFLINRRLSDLDQKLTAMQEEEKLRQLINTPASNGNGVPKSSRPWHPILIQGSGIVALVTASGEVLRRIWQHQAHVVIAAAATTATTAALFTVWTGPPDWGQPASPPPTVTNWPAPASPETSAPVTPAPSEDSVTTPPSSSPTPATSPASPGPSPTAAPTDPTGRPAPVANQPGAGARGPRGPKGRGARENRQPPRRGQGLHQETPPTGRRPGSNGNGGDAGNSGDTGRGSVGGDGSGGGSSDDGPQPSSAPPSRDVLGVCVAVDGTPLKVDTCLNIGDLGL